MRRVERGAGFGAGRGIKLGLVVEQNDRLEFAVQHLAGMQAIGTRQGTGQLGTNGVGSFSQIADRGTGLRAYPVGQRQQAGGIHMVRSGIAQQNGFSLAAQQRVCNRLGGFGGLPCGRRSQTFAERYGCGHIRQRLGPVCRGRQQGVGNGHRPGIKAGQLRY